MLKKWRIILGVVAIASKARYERSTEESIIRTTKQKTKKLKLESETISQETTPLVSYVRVEPHKVVSVVHAEGIIEN